MAYQLTNISGDVLILANDGRHLYPGASTIVDPGCAAAYTSIDYDAEVGRWVHTADGEPRWETDPAGDETRAVPGSERVAVHPDVRIDIIPDPDQENP